MRLLVHHCAICHNARGTARGTNLKRSEQNMVNILKRIWIFVHFEEVPRVVRVSDMPSDAKLRLLHGAIQHVGAILLSFQSN